MTRIAIFASYNKQGIVHDYVINYLKRLKRVANKIIFIADNNARSDEKEKLNGLVEFYSFAPHGEYDFGSYKRGYQHIMQQELIADEIILCNDSCFSIMDFDNMFDEMSQRDCDFWGITDNIEIKHHLQSYFLVFKKSVFTHKEFSNWINAIKQQDNVGDVVKNYEIPLTSFLEDIGFKSDVFIEYQEKTNPTVKPLTLLKQHMPLIKRKVFISKYACEESAKQLLIILHKKYKDSYKDICNYFRTDWNKLFPLMLPRDFEILKRFFYQKKITKSGKVIIKICKIPMPTNFLRGKNDKI